MQREAALGARQGVEIHPQVGHPSVVLASRPATSTTNLYSQRRRLPVYIHARARVARQSCSDVRRGRGGASGRQGVSQYIRRWGDRA